MSGIQQHQWTHNDGLQWFVNLKLGVIIIVGVSVHLGKGLSVIVAVARGACIQKELLA